MVLLEHKIPSPNYELNMYTLLCKLYFIKFYGFYDDCVISSAATIVQCTAILTKYIWDFESDLSNEKLQWFISTSPMINYSVLNPVHESNVLVTLEVSYMEFIDVFMSKLHCPFPNNKNATAIILTI